MKTIYNRKMVNGLSIIILPLMFAGCERSSRAPVQVKEPTGTIGRALPGEEVRDSRSATDRGSSRDATGQGTTTIDGVFADVDGPDDDWTETDTPPSDGTIPGNQRSQEVATGGSGLEIRLTDGSTTTINWDGLSDRSSDSKLKVKDVN